MTKKELLQMDYWELRKAVSQLVPRTFRLREDARKGEAVKEKGRKKNYHQYDLVGQEMTKRERLLNTEEVNSFMEISCRAQACPMPLNLDVYDGLLCGFKCIYCVPGKTRILMSDGNEIRAESVSVGDRIKSYNTETGIVEDALIEKVMSRTAPGVVEIVTTNGTRVQATPEHPIYTRDIGWLDAGGISPGDEVLVYDGVWVTGETYWERVDNVRIISQEQEVFNYHVSPNNNYFADKVLVHNCYADAFRASLYTSFFDNSKSVGLRHCNPDFYKAKLDDMFSKFLGKDPLEVRSDVGKALAKRIPIRFGIRFEDFLPAEKSKGISLELLNYLRKAEYPLMINTKSDLVGEDNYVRALSRNKAKTAVHITMISCDEDFLRIIEPGAPTFAKRLQAAKNLTEAGVRVVARIEPYMVFLNDSKDMVYEYFDRMKEAGVTHLTFDTYSYSANNPGIRQNFVRRGYDWERMFLLTSDSQAIGSLLLSKFMGMFREHGFKASTFDMGSVPDNDDTICCSVGDWFADAGYNWGCVVGAVRYIQERGLKPTSWNNFHRYVMRNGGFLSKVLEEEVKELWNLEGNASYFVNWGRGIEPCGHDDHGILWHYRGGPEADFRYNILEGVI